MHTLLVGPDQETSRATFLWEGSRITFAWCISCWGLWCEEPWGKSILTACKCSLVPKSPVLGRATRIKVPNWAMINILQWLLSSGFPEISKAFVRGTSQAEFFLESIEKVFGMVGWLWTFHGERGSLCSIKSHYPNLIRDQAIGWKSQARAGLLVRVAINWKDYHMGWLIMISFSYDGPW